MPNLTDELFSSQPGATTNSEDNLELKFAMKEIFSTKNIEMKTDLSQRQINAITRGMIYAKEFKSRLMQDLVMRMMRLMVSKGRKGRAEFIQMTQQLNNEPKQEEGIAQRLLGIK